MLEATSHDKQHPPRFGLLLDAGIPDGLGASIVYRPIKLVRLHAGATHNFVAPGVRAGATLVPFHFFVTPTATVEAGHYFEGDANWIVRVLSDNPDFENATLKRVSYDYANGQLGLEFLSQNRFLIYVHAGVSYFRALAKDFQKSIEEDGSSSGEDVKASDPVIRIVGPSAKAGLIVYF